MTPAIDLDAADAVWLERFFAAHDAHLSSQVPRTQAEAARWMIGEALGVSVKRVVLNPHTICVDVTDSVNTAGLIQILGGLLKYQGGEYLFASLEPLAEHVTEWGTDYTETWIEVTYRRR